MKILETRISTVRRGGVKEDLFQRIKAIFNSVNQQFRAKGETRLKVSEHKTKTLTGFGFGVSTVARIPQIQFADEMG